jgi:hypothetical protein
MKHSLVLSTAVMTFILATGNAVAQASGEGTKGPKQVVEEFLAMETNGGRLTPEGWRQADAFFARPAPEPSRRHIVVISPNYSVYETWTKGDQAQVYNDCEGLGQIDTALRYTPPESGVLKTTIPPRTHPGRRIAHEHNPIHRVENRRKLLYGMSLRCGIKRAIRLSRRMPTGRSQF